VACVSTVEARDMHWPYIYCLQSQSRYLIAVLGRCAYMGMCACQGVEWGVISWLLAPSHTSGLADQRGRGGGRQGAWCFHFHFHATSTSTGSAPATSHEPREGARPRAACRAQEAEAQRPVAPSQMGCGIRNASKTQTQ
jgi:hypothetical protein